MGNFAENLNLGNRFRPPLPQKNIPVTPLFSGVSRMAYPRGANRGRGFGAPGQIEEWRPSAEVLDGIRGLDARSDYFFFR